jgi:hypothetical protein
LKLGALWQWESGIRRNAGVRVASRDRVSNRFVTASGHVTIRISRPASATGMGRVCEGGCQKHTNTRPQTVQLNVSTFCVKRWVFSVFQAPKMLRVG